MAESIANILVKKDLKEYRYKKTGIEELEDKIKYLEENKLKNYNGWNSKNEKDWTERLIDTNAKLSIYKRNLEENKKLINSMDKAMEVLNKTEKHIIHDLYLSSNKSSIDQLCRKLNYSRSSIYKILDDAIHKLSLFLYGE